MRIRDIFLALLTMMIWGVNFAAAKIALGGFPPILLTALRFALVAIILVPFCPRPRRIGPVLGLAVTLGGLHFPLLFSGLARVDASTASVLMQLQVPFSVLLATLLLGEEFGWRRGLGMAIAFLGVVVIAGAPRLQENHLGIVLLLSAALVWGVVSIQLKRAADENPFTLNGWIAIFACIELTAISRVLERPAWGSIGAAGWQAWTALLYMTVFSSVIGYGLWFRLLNRYTVNQTVPFLLTLPVFAVIAGVALNGDRVTVDLAIGGLMTLAGVGICALRRTQMQADPAPNPA
jgi:O-acetylserine/cysteine efflux transporter